MTAFEFAIAALAIVLGTKLIRDVALRKHDAKMAAHHADGEDEGPNLTERIEKLEERIKTLERILTDPTSNLAREIDGL